MTELAFTVRDAYLTGLVVERGPMKPSADRMLNAQIGFEVAKAEFTPGEQQIKITTRFSIALYLGEPDSDAAGPDHSDSNLIGNLESKFTANIESSEVISEEDAESGRLDPATEAALVVLHPYHRALIESHSAMLGVSPLRLPVDWSTVAANLEGAPVN